MIQKNNLLVIDRDDATRGLISDLVGVRYKQIRVISSKELTQAIEFVEKETVGLILLDSSFFRSQLSDSISNLELLVNKTKSAPVVSLINKNIGEKPDVVATLRFADNLFKPFKPASLYLIIDKFLADTKHGAQIEEVFIKPDWANFRYIDVQILCQTYSSQKDKVIKILKLYPEHINVQLQKIGSEFRKTDGKNLLEQFQSLRTSFVYFSGQEVVSTIDRTGQR